MTLPIGSTVQTAEALMLVATNEMRTSLSHLSRSLEDLNRALEQCQIERGIVEQWIGIVERHAKDLASLRGT